jgi:hypothetical protein
LIQTQPRECHHLNPLGLKSLHFAVRPTLSVFDTAIVRYLYRSKPANMPKEEVKALLNFIRPYPPKVQEIALWLREWVWELYPSCNELIYDNYNAVAFGWSPTDRQGHTFCSIALASKYVHFGFYWGSEIADPERLLQGKGSQYRYIVINTKQDLPKTYVKRLLKEAYANSLAKVKDKTQILKGQTIVKSISVAKRRPLPS